MMTDTHFLRGKTATTITHSYNNRKHL